MNYSDELLSKDELSFAVRSIANGNYELSTGGEIVLEETEDVIRAWLVGLSEHGYLKGFVNHGLTGADSFVLHDTLPEGAFHERFNVSYFKKTAKK